MARPRKPSSTSTPSAKRRRRAILYTRVSTEEQREKGFSLEAQIDPLRLYCRREGIEIVAERVDAESAKKAGRKEFDAMVRDIQEGRADAIVVEKTDRIYRNFRDRVTVGDLIEDQDAELHLVKEAEVMSRRSTSHAKFIHDIKTVMAKNFVDNLSEEIRKGMRKKAEEGLWPSVAPIGYVNVPAPGRPSIVPHPEIAPLVLRLFQSYAEGEASLKRVAAWAQTLGLSSPRGGRLSSKQVHEMLRNPIYMGVVRWNGESFPGVHEPIVSAALYSKVQNVMEGRSEGHGEGVPHLRGDNVYAYRGLVTCGVCGCACSPFTAKGIYVYYACSGARGCRRAGLREEVVTEALALALDALTIDPRTLADLRGALREGHEEIAARRDETLRLLEARKESAKRRLDRLYRDRVEDEVPEETYRTLRPEYEAALSEVDEEIRALGAAERETWEESLGLLAAVSNSGPRFRKADPARRREMFKGLVSNCQIVDGKVEVTLRSWFKTLQEMADQAAREGVLADQVGNWYSGRDLNPRSPL